MMIQSNIYWAHTCTRHKGVYLRCIVLSPEVPLGNRCYDYDYDFCCFTIRETKRHKSYVCPRLCSWTGDWTHVCLKSKMKLWPLSCAVSSQVFRKPWLVRGELSTSQLPWERPSQGLGHGKLPIEVVWLLNVLVPVHLSMQFLFALANQLPWLQNMDRVFW